MRKRSEADFQELGKAVALGKLGWKSTSQVDEVSYYPKRKGRGGVT